MYHFQYVSREQYKPLKHRIVSLIFDVQKEVKNDFTFNFQFIGSGRRNMITEDVRCNRGFDFDVNFMLNEKKDYSPKEYRIMIWNALNKYANKYGFNKCEDSARTITLKIVDKKNSKIVHSCDIALVRNTQYILFNKVTHKCTWEKQPNEFKNLKSNEKKLKGNTQAWNEVRKIYLKKKNNNIDLNKKSRSLYAESINEVCSRYLKK